MAEDEDGASDKKSSQNSNNGATSQETEQNTTKPDLGIEEEKYNITDNGRSSPTESRSSTSSECFTQLFFVLNLKTFLDDCERLLQEAPAERGRRTIRFRSVTF